MPFVTTCKKTILGLLVATCGMQAAAHTYTPENTVVFVQGYNVIYVNSKTRIAFKCTVFAASNPSLLKLTFNRAFMSAVLAKLKQGTRLSDYYELFDIFDESGRIKLFARRMTVEGKDAIDDGIKAVQALLDAGYQVVILTGQDEALNVEFKKLFPIMDHPGIEIISSYDNNVASYEALKAASGKEHAFLLYGNRNHVSVDNADEAGLIIKHYSQALEA
jgi:hypothetical protein